MEIETNDNPPTIPRAISYDMYGGLNEDDCEERSIKMIAMPTLDPKEKIRQIYNKFNTNPVIKTCMFIIDHLDNIKYLNKKKLEYYLSSCEFEKQLLIKAYLHLRLNENIEAINCCLELCKIYDGELHLYILTKIFGSQFYEKNIEEKLLEFFELIRNDIILRNKYFIYCDNAEDEFNFNEMASINRILIKYISYIS